MVSTTRHPALRVEVPTLEPHAALLERLVAASVASQPSAGTSWMVGLRAALVAMVVAALGATTWAAGAMAGVETPFHQQIQRAPLVPSAAPGNTGSPQSDASPSGGPASTGLPDPQHAAHRAAHPARDHGHGRPGAGHRAAQNAAQPAITAPWPGLGRGHHVGWSGSGHRSARHARRHHRHGRRHHHRRAHPALPPYGMARLVR